ncbi:hypothetical protein J31TS4_29920 [Paenibacillus sp. J31TS4]|uniref:helix-turn-helix domain-containing protein n=1 Tax=Paenibacillus sp. J31TS4 TaxID=2807195 RepID=UPI001B141A4A|nr:AraC family transcriptional regulator [Paenibacillus sp. J31TS4]GIP39712.1 hypothetical protein J31TS4_29920 [Paenibacillus sp. J31TS4]
MARSGELSIKEISDRLRYTSVANFTRIFKKSTGLTPGAYRDLVDAGTEPGPLLPLERPPRLG